MSAVSISQPRVAAPLVAVPLVGAGLGLGALAFALFTVMDTTIKWLSAGYPVHELLFSNALFALVPVAVMTLRRGGLARLRTQRLHMHVLRGLLGMCGGFLAFYAYSQLPLADAYSMIFTTPLADHRALGADPRRDRRLAPLVGGRGRLRGRSDHAPAGGRADRHRLALGAGRGLLLGLRHPARAQAQRDREHRQHRPLQQPAPWSW